MIVWVYDVLNADPLICVQTGSIWMHIDVYKGWCKTLLA